MANSKLRAVFWDVDGTLSDTELKGHRIAFNKAFEKFNLNICWDEQEYINLLRIQGGFNRIKFYCDKKGISLDDSLISSLHKYKQEFYSSIIINGQLALRVGVQRLIKELYENHIIQYIVSTSSKKAVNSLIDNLLPDYKLAFSEYITYESVSKHKPYPEAYLLATAISGIDTQNIIAIEDSIAGLSSSHSAGIVTLVTLPSWVIDKKGYESASAIVDQLGDEKSPCFLHQGPACKDDKITFKYLCNLLK